MREISHIEVNKTYYFLGENLFLLYIIEFI